MFDSLLRHRIYQNNSSCSLQSCADPFDLIFEVCIGYSEGGWNFFHLSVLRHTPRLLAKVLSVVENAQIGTALNQGFKDYGYSITNTEAVLLALGSVSTTLHRNPLHLAAIERSNGSTTIVNGLDSYDIMLQTVTRKMDQVRHHEHVLDPRNMKDIYGKTPADYLFHASSLPKSAESIGKNMNGNADQDNGGWPDDRIVEHSLEDDPLRCDIDEFNLDGNSVTNLLLSELIDSGRPWIIRGATPSSIRPASDLPELSSKLSRISSAIPFNNAPLRYNALRHEHSKDIIDVDRSPYSSTHRSAFSNQDISDDSRVPIFMTMEEYITWLEVMVVCLIPFCVSVYLCHANVIHVYLLSYVQA